MGPGGGGFCEVETFLGDAFFIKRILNHGCKDCRLNNRALSKWVLCLSGREMVPTGQRPLLKDSWARNEDCGRSNLFTLSEG